MPGSIQLMGNGLAALWLALAALGAMTGSAARAQRSRDGTGLVMWGSYLVALLSLNIHTSPFGALPAVVQYAGVGLSGVSAIARLVVAAAIAMGARDRAWRAIPVCHGMFCVGIACASGNVVALATVIVAATAATAVALSHAQSGD